MEVTRSFLQKSFLLLTVLIFIVSSVEVLEEDVALPSGITLKPISEDPEFPDIVGSGSKTFRNGYGQVSDSRQISLNLRIENWRDASQAVFRLHPTFISCLQKVWSEVQNTGKKMRLIDGFLASGGSSLRDNYRKSGTGAALGFDASESNKDYKLLAKSFLRHCPPLFGPLGRDLGLIAEPEAIFVYMTGTKSPSLQSVTVSGNTQFNGLNIDNWVREQLNEVTDPVSVPECATTTPALSSGGIYPPGASSNPADTVGPLDKVVKPATENPDREDYIRLVQFSSDNIEFSIPSSASNNCPPGKGFRGNGPTTRCQPRLMSPRLYEKLNILQKLTRTTLSTKVRVEEGCTTDNVGAVDALRGECRQVKIKLVASSTAARLTTLSRLARCAAFDFIKHGGDHLVLAVAKQLKKNTKPVAFPKGSLIPVAAPRSDWESLYKLPDGFDNNDFPLFDSKYHSNHELEEGTTASLFKSHEDDVRYFRISPLMVKCLSEVFSFENRGKKDSEEKIQISVVRAYISNMQEKSIFNPIDVRLDKHTLGLALHLNYAQQRPGYDIWRLAETVATVCPSIIYNQEDKASNGRNVGLGIYTDGVFIGIRENMKVFLECESCDRLKPPTSWALMKEKLKTRIVESQANRIIDPNNWNVACTFDNPPSLQSHHYKFEHTEANKRVRRSTKGSADCQLNAVESSFCQKSRSQRQKEVEKIWGIIKLKHLQVDEVKAKAALDGCLLSCSKCTGGPQWDNKIEHCNNLAHWIPFGFLNDRAGVETHIYPRSDSVARTGACEEGGDCLDLTPIYGLFAPALDSKFRPETGKANKELVYDPVQNPSPLLNIMSRLYGLYARGRVTIWLRSEADITGMEDIIKVIFVYNKNVESIHLNILDKSAEGTIISSLEGRLDAWRTMVCPTHTRIALTPYSIGMATIAQSFAFNLRHQILAEEKALEGDGLRPDFI